MAEKTRTSPVATYRRESYPAISTTRPELSVAGKTIIVTGGAGGIGLDICKSFAAAGASNLILFSRRPEPLSVAKAQLEAEYPSTHVFTFTGSLTSPESITTFFKQARATVAEASILVLSAAYAPPFGTTLTAAPANISAVFDTNVIGNLNVVRGFLAVPSTPQNRKTIIDISSSAAHVRYPTIGPYCASKEAFVALLAHVLLEEKDTGLRVHSMHPGAVFTEMNKELGFGPDSVPWDKAGLAGDFAVWLASPEAEFLNGRFVWVNWDVEELKARKEEIEKSPDLLKITLPM